MQSKNIRRFVIIGTLLYLVSLLSEIAVVFVCMHYVWHSVPNRYTVKLSNWYDPVSIDHIDQMHLKSFNVSYLFENIQIFILIIIAAIADLIIFDWLAAILLGGIHKWRQSFMGGWGQARIWQWKGGVFELNSDNDDVIYGSQKAKILV